MQAQRADPLPISLGQKLAAEDQALNRWPKNQVDSLIQLGEIQLDGILCKIRNEHLIKAISYISYSMSIGKHYLSTIQNSISELEQRAHLLTRCAQSSIGHKDIE